MDIVHHSLTVHRKVHLGVSFGDHRRNQLFAGRCVLRVGHGDGRGPQPVQIAKGVNLNTCNRHPSETGNVRIVGGRIGIDRAKVLVKDLASVQVAVRNSERARRLVSQQIGRDAVQAVIHAPVLGDVGGLGPA